MSVDMNDLRELTRILQSAGRAASLAPLPGGGLRFECHPSVLNALRQFVANPSYGDYLKSPMGTGLDFLFNVSINARLDLSEGSWRIVLAEGRLWPEAPASGAYGIPQMLPPYEPTPSNEPRFPTTPFEIPSRDPVAEALEYHNTHHKPLEPVDGCDWCLE